MPAMDCCSQHGNICGDKCCDGTPFPTHCGDFRIIKLPPLSSATLEEDEENILQNPPQKWLYVWEDPQTGTPYFSSSYPHWYRNNLYPDSDKYPRVLVYDEYNRLIDDTSIKMDIAQTITTRKQAESIQQQQAAYQEAKEKQAEKQAKQTRLVQMLKDDKITEQLNQLLQELPIEQVTRAMAEAWGTPQVDKKAIVQGKSLELLKYQNGKQVTVVDGKVESLTTNQPIPSKK